MINLLNKNKEYDEVIYGYKNRRRRYILTILILIIFIFMMSIILLIYGKNVYSIQTVIKVLSNEKIKGATFVIKRLRLPRLIAGILCGFAFGISGNTFQQLLSNPLASPDIIGVTSGASLAAVFSIIVLRLNGTIVSLISIAVGLLVSLIIYLLSKSNGYSNGRLILTGIGMKALLGALISYILLRAPEYDIPAALRWLSGSLNGIQMNKIPSLLIIVIISSFILIIMNKHLLIMKLSEEHAKSLGISLNKTRLILIFFSILVSSHATSIAGPIASVAFLSGPIANRIGGEGNSNILTSALTGSLLVLLSDFVGQFALSHRYPIGVITGFLGAPYLLYLLIKMNKRGDK